MGASTSPDLRFVCFFVCYLFLCHFYFHPPGFRTDEFSDEKEENFECFGENESKESERSALSSGPILSSWQICPGLCLSDHVIIPPVLLSSKWCLDVLSPSQLPALPRPPSTPSLLATNLTQENLS